MTSSIVPEREAEPGTETGAPVTEYQYRGDRVTVQEQSDHHGYTVTTGQCLDDTHRWIVHILTLSGKNRYLSPPTFCTDATAATRWARRLINKWMRNDELYPQLLATAGMDARDWDVVPASVRAGDVVGVFSRGQLRPGIVDKTTGHGRANVAYITKNGIRDAKRLGAEQASITRKTVPFGELRLPPQSATLTTTDQRPTPNEDSQPLKDHTPT
jgi:hypothetical protein